MPRPIALLALAMFAFSRPILADEPEKPAPSQSEKPESNRGLRYRQVSPEAEAKFKAHVARGDRALEAGRLNDAVIAYLDALDTKFDARISGRLGLVLSVFVPSPQIDIKIAHFLLDAVDDAAGISTAERRAFFDAYERVRKRVCRLEIVTNYVDAVVAIDNHKASKSKGAFWTFIAPGKNNVIASLPGREDIKHVVDCIPGKGILVEFEFPPLPGEDAKTVVVKEPPERVIIREEFPRDELRPPEPVIKKDEPPRPRFAGGIGPIMVFGAAPSPSLGVSITGQYRMDGLMVMGIAKGAWSLASEDNPPINISSVAGIVGPCVQLQWLDACAFGGATLFERRVSPNPSYRVDSVRDVIPSFGLGIGSTFRLRESVAARVFVDATALTRDMVIGVIASDNTTTPLWQTQRFMLSISASLMFGR